MELFIWNGQSFSRINIGEERAFLAKGYNHKVPDFPYIHIGAMNPWIPLEWGYDTGNIDRWYTLAWDNIHGDAGKMRSLLKFSSVYHRSMQLARSFGREHGYLIRRTDTALKHLLSLDKTGSK